MGKLKSNLIYNIVYQILILIVPFVTTPYISRVLGPTGVGVYSVTTAIAKYFWLFGLLGMSNYGNRMIAKVRDDKKKLSSTFWNLYYFQAIISSLCFAFFLLYVIIIGKNQYGDALLCQIPYVLSAFFEIGWFFYGLEAFKYMVIRNVVIKILTTISIFLFVNSRNDTWIYILINALSLLLGQLCLWTFLKRKITFVRPIWTIIISHFKPNLVLFVSVVAVSIYTLMDKIMLEYLSSTRQVGYFENTEKIMNICCSVVGAIGTVMLPRISYLVEKNDNHFIKQYLDKSMKYIMMLAVAISFGVAGISKEFSVVFFGKEFEATGNLLAFIAPAIVFYSWENILRTQYLLPGNRDEIFVKGTVFAAIINISFNFVLIPRIGALGAVLGTVAAQFTASLYQSLKVRAELPILRYLGVVFPSIVIGVFMFIYCRIIGRISGYSILTLVLQVCGGGFLFGLCAFILLVSQKDENVLKVYNLLRFKIITVNKSRDNE